MRKIKLGDGTEYSVSDIKKGQIRDPKTKETKNTVSFVFLSSNVTYSELREKLSDPLCTGIIQVFLDTGQEMTPYEGYTALKRLSEDIDAGTVTAMLAETSTIAEDVQALTVAAESQKNQIQTMQESEELYSAAVVVARAKVQELTDSEALQAKVLHDEWATLVEQNFTAPKEGFRFRHGNELYKTAQDNVPFQAQWVPGEQGTESLYTHIDDEHAGTLEDPIPAMANMEYEYGKYYLEGDTVYLCQRGGISNPEELYGKKITLQYTPSQLLGQYFVVAG